MSKLDKLISLLVFTVTFIIYSLTVSKTISFWDSPEFVSSSFSLQPTHPPGAPLYTILCSVVLFFTPGLKAAFISNLISTFFGAITCTFVYSITSKIISQKNKNVEYLAISGGLISAFSLAFSSSFWIAATETEVYTMSFAFLTAIIYTMLCWESTKNKALEKKYLLLIAFLFGLSAGVHLITLLAIIPLSIIYTNKKYELSVFKGITALVIGSILFVFAYFLILQGWFPLASKLDVFLVNKYNYDVNSGLYFLIIGCVFVLTFALWITYKKQLLKLHNITLGLVLFLLGTSSYLMPILRADANFLSGNSTHTSNRVAQYIRGDQFGISSIPLLYGSVFNAPLDKEKPFINDSPIYTYNSLTKKYELIDDGNFSKVNYASEFNSFFPRLFNIKDINRYPLWTTIYGKTIIYPEKGVLKKFQKPTTKENLSFFYNYQVDWLYLRYLFWNFVGKQNNNHGLGHIKDGNWISGFNFIDASRIGDHNVIPEHYKNDKSRNAYFFLPLLFGLVGLFVLRKQKQYFITTLLLFLAFGIGITIIINPVPSSILVRERDYIFVGSFVIFAIWIGLSVVALFNLLKMFLSTKISRNLSFILILGLVPIQLLSKGWDDHQRSNDNFAYNLGKLYLDSCPEQAILITNGDNMTFPLWYLQEVENYRTDVRVLNFDQLNLEGHIENLKTKHRKSNPIKLNLSKELYIEGQKKLFPLNEEINFSASIPILFEFLKDSTTRILWNNKKRHYIPSKSFTIQIDTTRIKNMYKSPKEYNASFLSSIDWSLDKDFYGLNELVVFNIINNNIYNRNICFADNSKTNHYAGLEKYTIKNGLVDILAPIARKDKSLNPKIIDTEKMLSLVYENFEFDKIHEQNNFVQYETRTYAQNILRRNYYFLVQALLEEGKKTEAQNILDKCFTYFPNEPFTYKQYAFALGKLYFRIGQKEKGLNICKTSMQNILDEIKWITSFNPPNPIMNASYVYKQKEIYKQMVYQLNTLSSINSKERLKTLDHFESIFEKWKLTNWPY